MLHPAHHRLSPNRRVGFTLVELLVVIGIIAVLITILLPTLNTARREGNRIKCMANLRSIVQAMNIYAAAWKGAIMGTPWTTGRRLMDPLTRNFATTVTATGDIDSIVQSNDWMAPTLYILNPGRNPFPPGAQGPSIAERRARFDYIRQQPIFRCPENEFLAPPASFAVPRPAVDIMLSYTAAFTFGLLHKPATVPDTAPQVGAGVGRSTFNPPPDYNVTLQKIGDASRKIYIADGARFSNTNQPPSVEISARGNFGGSISDIGPHSLFSNSWDRGLAPGNINRAGGSTDARIYAFRHGNNSRARGPANSFRLNVAFFDGRVETLGDLEAANPYFWGPKGTSIDITRTNNASQNLQNDVLDFYRPASVIPW